MATSSDPSTENVELRQAISAPLSKASYTRWVFATIADRYDLVNVLLSFNRDQAWKRRLVQRAAVRVGERALDLACGTGDITFRLAEAGASAVGLDVTHRMIELARAKPQQAKAPAQYLVGDMMQLPFPAESFDVVTTGYGLRNVPDIGGALAEVRRVLTPGGRLLSLDFNRPPNGVVRWAYLAYLSVVGRAIGWLLYRKPDTYRYIPETIRLHPGAEGLNRLIEQAGFERVSYHPVFGGFMALHTAAKPRREV